MVDHAVKAVVAFFDRYEEFSALDARVVYVGWAVPEPEERIDQHGRKVLVPP